MNKLSSKELDLYSNQILEDYDAKKPSQIFKNKVKVSNEDALLIQNKVTELRVSRGEEVIGYKIGCISKERTNSCSGNGDGNTRKGAKCSESRS